MYRLTDNFNGPSGLWTSETGVVWNGYPLYRDSAGSSVIGIDSILMNAPNIQGGRYITTIGFTDKYFNIVIRARRWWKVPSNYNGASVRAWVGLYQSGVATQWIDDPIDITGGYGYGKSHKLWLGLPASRTSFFNSSTHYVCELNEAMNWGNNQTGDDWANVRFIRNGDTVEVSVNFEWPIIEANYLPFRTFTIEQPDDPLFFEFVEFDWHNMAKAYTEYFSFAYEGIGYTSGSMSLSISGTLISSLSPLNIIDRLSKVSDYDPQLLGTFTNAVNNVTIRLWELSDGQNTVVPVIVSGCSQIGDTERWIWSTSNLPEYTGYRRQLFYAMTADNNETSSGQFFLDLPENPKGMYPISISEFLL